MQASTKNGIGGAGTSALSRHRARTHDVCARLQAVANELGPNAKLPSVAELRAFLGAGNTTINDALRELERRGVLYGVRGVGIFVAPRAVCTIALVCDAGFFRGAGHSPFWDLLVERAQERAVAGKEACSLHFAASAGSEAPLHDGLMSEVRAGRVQGVLGVGLNEAATKWIEAKGVPYVAFAGPGKWRVGQNTLSLIRQGVAHLARQGCRRIGLWESLMATESYEPSVESAAWALHHFQQALSEIGVEFCPELVRDNCHWITDERNSARAVPTAQEQGFSTAQDVFCAKRNVWPDGILMTHDLLTHGALLALQKMGVRVGHDVHIISHANKSSPVLMGREDEVALLEYDPAEVVDTMFFLLETLMNGQTPAQECIIVEPHLRGA